MFLLLSSTYLWDPYRTHLKISIARDLLSRSLLIRLIAIRSVDRSLDPLRGF